MYKLLFILSSLLSLQAVTLSEQQSASLLKITDDQRVQHCVDDIRAIQVDVRAIVEDMKHGKADDVLRRMADVISLTYDFRDMCQNLKPEEIAQYMYDHLNKDGQNCVDGVLNWRRVADYITELAQGSITFRQFIEAVDPYIQKLPDLVDNCKNAHWRE